LARSAPPGKFWASGFSASFVMRHGDFGRRT
jgi:hypothetical protein